VRNVRQIPNIQKQNVKFATLKKNRDMKWISTKDKLPEFRQEVVLAFNYEKNWKNRLKFWKNKRITFGYLYSIEEFICDNKICNNAKFKDVVWDSNYTDETVTHWMPLPKPPKK
jgi:hypothetical protein